MATKVIALNTDLQTAYASVSQSLTQNSAEITAQQAPTFLAYTMQHSSIWTGYFKIKLEGTVRLESGAGGQTVAQIEINLAKNALLNNVGAQGVFGLVIGALFLGPLTLLIVPLATAGTYMYLNNTLADQTLGKLGGVEGASAMPSSQATGAAQPINGSATTAGSSSPVLAQLKSLGELRDAGVVSADEFETKKTELLARL
jgi:hypothetical protein